MKLTKTFPLLVTHYRKEPVGPPARGYRSVPDRTTRETVEVTIDLGRIIEVIGNRAVRNKRGRATQAAGMIVVKHIRPKRKKGES